MAYIYIYIKRLCKSSGVNREKPLVAPSQVGLSLSISKTKAACFSDLCQLRHKTQITRFSPMSISLETLASYEDIMNSVRNRELLKFWVFSTSVKIQISSITAGKSRGTWLLSLRPPFKASSCVFPFHLEQDWKRGGRKLLRLREPHLKADHIGNRKKTSLDVCASY